MADPVAGYNLSQQFYTLDLALCWCLSVFVAVTEREIRVRTHRQTVLINANFWPCVQHPRPYCIQQLLPGSVLFRVYSFPSLPQTVSTCVQIEHEQL